MKSLKIADDTQNFKPDFLFFLFDFSSPSSIAEQDLHLHAICGYCIQSNLKGNQLTFATGPKVIIRNEWHALRYVGSTVF